MTPREIEDMKLKSLGAISGLKLAIKTIDNYPTIEAARKHLETRIKVEAEFVANPQRTIRELGL